MGVDEGATTSGQDVLEDSGFKKGGFPGPGLAEYVRMKEPVGLSEAKSPEGGARVRLCEEGDVRWGVHVPTVSELKICARPENCAGLSRCHVKGITRICQAEAT